MRKRLKVIPAESRLEQISSWAIGLTAAILPLAYWPVARDPNLAKPIVLILGLTAVLIAFCVAMMRGERVRFRWTSLDFLVLLYLLITCASWTYSHFRYATAAAIRPILVYTILYFSARVAMPGEPARRRVATGLIIGSVAVSFLAIVERYHGLPWHEGTPVVSTWFNRTFLAAHLLLVLPIAAWAIASPGKLRVAGVIGLAAGLPALMFSQARVAWVALFPMAVAAVVVGWPMIAPRRRGLILRAAISAVVLLALLQIGLGRIAPRWTPTHVAVSALNRGAGTEIVRVVLMEAAWRVGLDRPLLGGGAGTYPIYAPARMSQLFYRDAFLAEGVRGMVVIVNAHNEFLEVFAELGAIGMSGGARRRRPVGRDGEVGEGEGIAES